MTTVIESPRNERIKTLVRLRDRRERDRTGMTLVDGAREIRRAIEAGVRIEAVYGSTTLATDPETARAVEALHDAGLPILAVAPVAFERIAYGERTDGLVALVETPRTDLAVLADRGLPSEPLIVVIDGVEKPGNVGAIVRSADGAGADALIVTDPGTDLYNPNAIRASIGTIFRLGPVRATPEATAAWLATHRIRVVVARLAAAEPYETTDLTGPLALVVGSEATGVGATWTTPDVAGVRLPMLGVADSLNVSVAAAILLYEARRQRGVSDPRLPPGR